MKKNHWLIFTGVSPFSGDSSLLYFWRALPPNTETSLFIRGQPEIPRILPDLAYDLAGSGAPPAGGSPQVDPKRRRNSPNGAIQCPPPPTPPPTPPTPPPPLGLVSPDLGPPRGFWGGNCPVPAKIGRTPFSRLKTFR